MSIALLLVSILYIQHGFYMEGNGLKEEKDEEGLGREGKGEGERQELGDARLLTIRQIIGGIFQQNNTTTVAVGRLVHDINLELRLGQL
jgi:hypothetical protein